MAASFFFESIQIWKVSCPTSKYSNFIYYWGLIRTMNGNMAIKNKQDLDIIIWLCFGREPQGSLLRIHKWYLNKILSLSGPNLKLTRVHVIILITGKIWKLWVLTSSRWVTEISSRARIITRHVYPPASWGWVFTSIGL